AAPWGSGAARRRLGRQAMEIVRQAAGGVEILGEPPPPCRRQIERLDQRREQTDVADADLGRLDAVMRERLEPEREHLGVGRRSIASAEGFDAGLQELARLIAALAKYGTEIAEAYGLAGGARARCEVIARDRDGQVGSQAELAARRLAREIHAPADVLAGKVEERLGRLQDGGLGAPVAGARVGCDERLRARIGPVRLCCRL